MKERSCPRDSRSGPRWRRWGVIACGSAVVAACKHPSPPSPSEGADAGVLATTSVGPVPDGGAAPRCNLVAGEGTRATLTDVGDRRSLEIGEGIATPEGTLVGIVHSPSAGPEALVARVAGSAVNLEWTVATRAELVPDAPPPKPLAAGASIYAAYLTRAVSGDAAGSVSRQLVLKKSGVAAPLAAFPERAAESLSFDAALSVDASHAAIVWDEDEAKGGITLGVVSLAGGRPVAPRVVSGETADPDGPRLATRSAGGWWVAWIAHRVDSAADASGGSLEAPAEDRAYSWLEVVTVAEDGSPIGPPRRITSASGRVASFDVAPSSRGGLDVVARDETQPREGEGGRVLHVVVQPDGTPEDPSVLVSSGVGRGSVDLVTGLGEESWLAFSDMQDRAAVVPLGSARGASGLPSVEEALEGGRLLTLTPVAGAAGARGHFVAAFPGIEGPLFREIACVP
jgi:hypothetical protein